MQIVNINIVQHKEPLYVLRCISREQSLSFPLYNSMLVSHSSHFRIKAALEPEAALYIYSLSIFTLSPAKSFLSFLMHCCCKCSSPLELQLCHQMQAQLCYMKHTTRPFTTTYSLTCNIGSQLHISMLYTRSKTVHHLTVTPRDTQHPNKLCGFLHNQ